MTEMRFNSPECIEKCTRFEAADFSLSLDEAVAGHPEARVIGCDTRTSGRRRSDGNIELVRFLDSHEGDGARAVFAGVQLIYRNNTHHDNLSKFAHC